jgi:hypothetical protein
MAAKAGVSAKAEVKRKPAARKSAGAKAAKKPATAKAAAQSIDALLREVRERGDELTLQINALLARMG